MVADYLCWQARERCLLVCHVVLVTAIRAHVEVVWETLHSRLGEDGEPLGELGPPVSVRVVVRAVGLVAKWALLAFLGFQEVWMVFLFFPAMGVLALVHVWTAFLVGGDEVAGLPVWTHLARVLKD